MIVYSPPYENLVWEYRRTNTDVIINQVDWEFLFLNKNVHQQVKIFNKTLIDIFSNFIPINMSLLTIRILNRWQITSNTKFIVKSVFISSI